MAMAKFTVDTTNKLFVAKPGVIAFDVRVDLYSDAKEHWIADDAANKFTFPFIDITTGLTTAQGGPDIDPAEGTVIPTYLYLENGWRVRPDESDHTVKVTGGVLLVQGGGDPFVDTLGAFTVRVNYQQPVQAIGVVKASVLAPTAQQIRDALKLSPSAGAPAANSIDEHLDDVLADTAAIDGRLPSDPADESLQQASHAQTQADIAALGIADMNTLVTEIWQRLGMDPDNPLVNSATQITVGGDIVLDVADVAGVVTITRV